MKSADENHDITVFERNPAGQTYGWGVVYWDDLIEKLYANDPDKLGQFYSSLFDWNVEPVSGMDYRMVRTVDTDADNHPAGPGAL